MSPGVSSIDIIGLVIIGPSTITKTVHANVAVMVVPIVCDRFSRSFAPKYWDAITLAPTATPINSTSKRFITGPLAPIAARALSPT